MKKVFLVATFLLLILTVKGRGFFHHYHCKVYEEEEKKEFSINVNEKISIAFQDGRLALEIKKKDHYLEFLIQRSIHIVDKSYEKKIHKRFSEAQKIISLNFLHLYGSQKENVFLSCRKGGMS